MRGVFGADSAVSRARVNDLAESIQVMDESLPNLFTGRAAFDPAADGAFFESVPAKACVALFYGIGCEPLQLVCTKNLRAMLRRRLAAQELGEAALPGKRIDYRTLVSEVAWRRVDGEFEMDLVYIEAARQAFPSHWRRLIPDRVSHFVTIDLAHPHPDFIRITDPTRSDQAVVFGPFPDKAKADRWIELARDAFDLCRYRAILAQAPNGRACAYKQMNKCPAPCDGTVPIEAYRRGVSDAVAAIRNPTARAAEMADAMKAHAGRLEFEQAGRLKSRLTTFTQLGEGPNRSVRPIEAFRFIAVEPGPRKGTAKIFAITATAIVEAAAVVDAPAVALDDILQVVDAPLPPSPWPADVLLGLACFHLTGPKSGRRFAARADLTDEVCASLIAEATRPRAAREDSGEAIRETRIEA